jgi:F-type H+-transporting ATPase subunit delta
MNEERVGYRYAKAVFDLAIQNGATSAANADIQLIAETCAGSDDLMAFLRNPVIPNAQKHIGLTQIFADKLQSVEVKGLIDLVVDNNREKFLPNIASSFTKLYDEFTGVERALLTSADTLSPEMVTAIKTTVEQKLGKKLIITEKIDASLIGGYILKVGDKLFDGSVATNLRKLHNEFTDKSYVKQF